MPDIVVLATELVERAWRDRVIDWGATAAAATAIFVLAGTLWAALHRATKVVRREAAEWRDGIVSDVEAKVAPQLALTMAQLVENGGTSLRDAVDRIEDRGELTATEVASLRSLLTEHLDHSSLDRSDLRRWLEHLDPGRRRDPGR